MQLKDALLGWNPVKNYGGDGRIIVLDLALGLAIPDEYDCTHGACCDYVQENVSEINATAFILAFAINRVRDGLDPETVHSALMAVDEYRNVMGDDRPIWPDLEDARRAIIN